MATLAHDGQSAKAKTDWNSRGPAGRLALCILCGWTTGDGRPSYTAKSNSRKEWDDLTSASQRVIARYLDVQEESQADSSDAAAPAIGTPCYSTVGIRLATRSERRAQGGAV